MHLMRYRPTSLNREFDALMSAAFDTPRWTTGSWKPGIDVFEADEQLVVRVALPGFDADQLELTLEDGLLSLTGTREFTDSEDTRYHRRELATGSFSRTIRVGDAYDAESVAASYTDGILTVTLAKRPEVLPRKIDIVTS